MKGLLSLLPVLVLAISLNAQTQTSAGNQSGGCNTSVSCSLPLTGGTGNINFAAVVGPGCALGQSCRFGYAYAGSFFSYRWLDGSTGSASDFVGTMTFNGANVCGNGCTAYLYTITGTFSGTDSEGRAFSGSTLQQITIDRNHLSSTAKDTSGTTTLSISSTSTSPSQLSLSASPPSQTIVAGQTATVTIQITGQGLTSPVSLDCAGLPIGASCAFEPASSNVGTNSAVSTLTISTTVRTSAHRKRQLVAAGAVVLAVGSLLGSRRRRKLLLSFVVLCLLAACGGSGGNQPAPAVTTDGSGGTLTGTYQIGVTATSGSLHSSTIVNLTVE
jgi:hypothetical protein